jgi:hypothetical protein
MNGIKHSPTQKPIRRKFDSKKRTNLRKVPRRAQQNADGTRLKMRVYGYIARNYGPEAVANNGIFDFYTGSQTFDRTRNR